MSYLRNFTMMFNDQLDRSFEHFLYSLVVAKETVGIFHWLPFGIRLRHKVETIIRQAMLLRGEEVDLSALITEQTFTQSGRIKIFGDEILKVTDSSLLLSPTNEEVFFQKILLQRDTYKNYPKFLFQIGHKYRKEIRPRGELLRTIDFIMKDGYYFTSTHEDNRQFYHTIKQDYINLFEKLGLHFVVFQADGSSMLSSYSEEFVHLDPDISEVITPDQQTGVEIGHIFDLGTQYSQDSKTSLVTQQNTPAHIYSSSYGIGVSRIIYIICKKLFNKDYVTPQLLPFLLLVIGTEADIAPIRQYIGDMDILYSHQTYNKAMHTACMMGIRVALKEIDHKTHECTVYHTMLHKKTQVPAEILRQHVQAQYISP